VLLFFRAFVAVANKKRAASSRDGDEIRGGAQALRPDRAVCVFFPFVEAVQNVRARERVRQQRDTPRRLNEPAASRESPPPRSPATRRV